MNNFLALIVVWTQFIRTLTFTLNYATLSTKFNLIKYNSVNDNSVFQYFHLIAIYEHVRKSLRNCVFFFSQCVFISNRYTDFILFLLSPNIICTLQHLIIVPMHVLYVEMVLSELNFKHFFKGHSTPAI